MIFNYCCGDFLLLKEVDIGSMSKERQLVLFEAVEMDFEKNLVYSLTYEDSAVKIRKVRIPVFSVGLNEKIDDSTYLCAKKGIVPSCHRCRKFKYDPLKRVPARRDTRALEKLDEKDFSL